MKTNFARAGKWAAAGLATGAVIAGGLFWRGCEQRSDAYDLSALAQMPGRVSLSQTPRRFVDSAVGMDDLTIVQKLVETQFGVGSTNLSDRMVRDMVASHIQEKFSSREILEFYLNRVSPGADTLRAAAAAQTAAVHNDVQLVANVSAPVVSEAQHNVPAEISPVPEVAPEPPVRRAVAVVEAPAPRAMAVEAAPSDSRPVLRAHAASLSEPAWSEVGEAGDVKPVGSTVQLSRDVIYRVAVADLH